LKSWVSTMVLGHEMAGFRSKPFMVSCAADEDERVSVQPMEREEALRGRSSRRAAHGRDRRCLIQPGPNTSDQLHVVEQCLLIMDRHYRKMAHYKLCW